MNWWSRYLPARMKEFISWLGGADAPSRVKARELILEYKPVSILDVACGPAVEARSWGKKWHGCDTCQVLIDYAAERGITVEHGDAEKLPYKTGQFDVVYARHLWEHLNGYTKALSEAMRVAGKLVVHVFFRPPQEKQKLGEVQGTPENIYSKRSIEAAIKKHDPKAVIRWEEIDNEEILLIEKGK